MSAVLRLPPELVHFIYAFLEPSYHFSFAITCKSIFYQSGYIFQLHRKAHSGYRVASDRYPQDVVHLFLSAEAGFGLEAIAAWHVREFEVWGNRRNWNEWRSWLISPDGRISLAMDEQPFRSPVDPSLAEDEHSTRSLLIEIQLEHLARSILHDDDKRLVRAAIQMGDDGFFKARVISLFPRLKVLKFVEIEGGHPALSWISAIASWSKIHGLSWPPGLLALSEVAVHIPINVEEQIDECSTEVVDLGNLLGLPGIRYVYFRNLLLQFEDDDLLLPGNSTVGTLMLDQIKLDNFRLRKAICNAPSRLESFVVRGSTDPAHFLDSVQQFPRLLSQSRSCKTLRKVLFYNPDRMRGSTTDLFEPAYINTMSGLRVVDICIGDMQVEAFAAADHESVRARTGTLCGRCCHDKIDLGDYCHGDIPCESPDNVDAQPAPPSDSTVVDDAEEAQSIGQEGLINHDDLVRQFVIGLPESLEVLLIHGQEENTEYFDRGPYEENETIDDAVVAMLESGHYPNLEVIYLDQVERCVAEPRHVVSFQKAIAAGRKHGVYIFTVANQVQPPGKSRFPAMPDRHDLKTGPFPQRGARWYVDPYTGSWTPPGCGGCGLCGDCLRCYTAEAWEAFRNRADD
ncbi:unnamed protein product [Clonostachys chloroleuca]|uniref:F-box domain-containing protein n=1 Tax=Clonostachys chloroleuca TaxID=1926264 RepID=A0AA35LU54_9HYPO|nr:unnamed protein product [Clonostachys chloroleuca]